MLFALSVHNFLWLYRKKKRRLIFSPVAEKWDNVPVQPLTDKRAAQWKNITTYRWVDEKKTKAAIPVSEAMKLLVEQHQGKGSSAKID